jgi:hypothetical protein
VNASPPSYLDKPENYLNRQGSSWILANYRTVSEALSALNEGKWSGGPGFIIIADSQEVAMIEFALMEHTVWSRLIREWCIIQTTI